MTRLDAIRERLKEPEMQRQVWFRREDVAWLVETVDAFRRAAELVGHASHEDGCNMCTALARVEAPDGQ